MTDQNIKIKKIEERRLNHKGNEELVQRTTYIYRDGTDYKVTSDIKKMREKKIMKKEIAERMKIPKFGACAGQPRGSLEAGVILISKEEVKIVNREKDVELDMKERLIDSISSKKRNVLREMQDIKEKEKQQKLALLFSSTKAATMIKRNRPRENSIKVSGFNPSYKEDDLWRIFEKVGRVRKVYIPKDFYTGAFKNFAFVDFEQSASVKDAVERFNDEAVDSCVLNVTKADDK
jgi:RNA recognition motif-containing protein